MSAYSFSFAGAKSVCGKQWARATVVGRGEGVLPLLRRSGNVDAAGAVALMAHSRFDADGRLERMDPALIVALTRGVGETVTDELLARAGATRKRAKPQKTGGAQCSSAYHRHNTDPQTTPASRAHKMCSTCYRHERIATSAAWPLVARLDGRVSNKARDAFAALHAPGCRGRIVAAAAGGHDLAFAWALKGNLTANAWQALPCTQTLVTIERSRAKEHILEALPEVIATGWAQCEPFARARKLFRGPDLYHDKKTLLLGTAVATCRRTVTIHTAGTTGAGPVDKATWAELERAAEQGAVHGTLKGAAAPFLALVAAADYFPNITVVGPTQPLELPALLVSLVTGHV